MPVTLIVEPDVEGHRFHAAGNVAALAARTDEIVLLTSRGATSTDEFGCYLGEMTLEVDERFTEKEPPTRVVARAIAEHCRTRDVRRVVVMDADKALKRWWYIAPREFRGLARRPQVIFMLTRYPARLGLTDRVGWKLRLTKGSLALAAMATRSLHRVAGFAGREDLARGWLVKRARDPATCGAHSRDRAAIRAELGLPAGRLLVGLFGVITERKKVPFNLECILATGLDVDLLLAGVIDADVAAWIAAQPPEIRQRIIVREGFLPNEVLDHLVAASDAIVIALTNNGPSGIMGKALAAGVPVVSAGSTVRARELELTRGGIATEFTVDGVSAGLARLLSDPDAMGVSAVPLATDEGFAAALLGVEPVTDPALGNDTDPRTRGGARERPAPTA